jgi:hypothetical protein
MAKSVPTQRAPDEWDSARFKSIFLALAFSCSQAESTPAHQRLTQTVRRLSSEKGYVKLRKIAKTEFNYGNRNS